MGAGEEKLGHGGLPLGKSVLTTPFRSLENAPLVNNCEYLFLGNLEDSTLQNQL